jgi:iron complex transport system substrate-binding protein
MMKKRIAAMLLILTAGATHAGSFPVTVDSCGEKITFDAPPKRAVINDLNMAEMAFALGLQPHIVGLTGISGWYKATAEFTRKQGRIPELAPKYPSMETLLAVDPDFFFAGWNYGMKVGGEVTPAKLAKFNIKTLVLSESCVWVRKDRPEANMSLLYGDIIKLGQIFDRAAQAEALVAQWQQKLDAIHQKVAGRSVPKVFVYDSGEDKPFTSGKYAMPQALIAAAGGRNVMGNMNASWATTSWEAVAQSEPDLIILLDYQTANGVEDLRHFLSNHSLMKLTPAVRNQRYINLQYSELTPGPANIGAIEKLARALHPEAFK